MANPALTNVCVKVSGVPDAEGNVFTAEALQKAAAEDPENFWVKIKPDGRVELWTRVRPFASPLSSKESPDG